MIVLAMGYAGVMVAHGPVGGSEELVMKYEVELPEAFEAVIRKQTLGITLPQELPASAIRKVFEYGLQRILNDASAGADSPEAALAAAQKRWDSLVAGEIRQSSNRTGDPVAREANRLAVLWVQSNAKFKAWAKENGLKSTDKEFTGKVAELAKAKREAFMEQAKLNLAALADLDIEELDIELGAELEG